MASRRPARTVRGVTSIPGTATATGLAGQWCAADEMFRLPNPSGPPVFAELRASGLVLTAPHAVGLRRDRRSKPADIATGGLAVLLARCVGASVLAAARPREADPSWVGAHPLKDALADVLARGSVAVVDVHGMHDGHGVDVCVGLGPDPRGGTGLLAEALTGPLRQAGLKVSVDAPFTARRTTTVTAFAQSRGVPAVQLEVARRWRDPWADPARAAQLVELLVTGLTAFVRQAAAGGTGGAA